MSERSISGDLAPVVSTRGARKRLCRRRSTILGCKDVEKRYRHRRDRALRRKATSEPVANDPALRVELFGRPSSAGACHEPLQTALASSFLLFGDGLSADSPLLAMTDHPDDRLRRSHRRPHPEPLGRGRRASRREVHRQASSAPTAGGGARRGARRQAATSRAARPLLAFERRESLGHLLHAVRLKRRVP